MMDREAAKKLGLLPNKRGRSRRRSKYGTESPDLNIGGAADSQATATFAVAQSMFRAGVAADYFAKKLDPLIGTLSSFKPFQAAAEQKTIESSDDNPYPYLPEEEPKDAAEALDDLNIATFHLTKRFERITAAIDRMTGVAGDPTAKAIGYEPSDTPRKEIGWNQSDTVEATSWRRLGNEPVPVKLVGWDPKSAQPGRDRGAERPSEFMAGVKRLTGATVAQKVGQKVLPKLFQPSGGLTSAADAAAPTIGAGKAAASLGGMKAALTGLAAPLAAIAAAVASVYLVVAKWDKLPGVVKAILLPVKLLAEYVIVCAKAFWLAIAPIRLAADALFLFLDPLIMLPRTILAIPGAVKTAITSLPKLAATAASAIAKVTASAATSTATIIGKGVVSITKGLAGAIPAGIEMAKSAISGVGRMLEGIGSSVASGGARIKAAFADAAEQVVDLSLAVDDISMRFRLSAEQAAVYAYAARISGESVEALRDAIAPTSDQFARLQKEATAAGVVLGETTVSAAVRLRTEQERLTESMTGLKTAFGTAVLEPLTEVKQIFSGTIRGVTDWISKHQELVKTAFRVASAVAGIGTALTVLGTVASTAGAFLTPIIAVIAGLTGVVAAWDTQVGRMARGGAQDFWSAYGGSLKDTAEMAWQYGQRIVGFTTETVGGIVSALKAGDLETAGRVAMDSLKLGFTASLQEIASLVSDRFGTGAGGIFENLAAGEWQKAGQGAMTALKIVWLTGVGELSAIWQTLRDTFDDVTLAGKLAWNDFTTALAAATLDFVTVKLPAGWQAGMDMISSAWDSLLTEMILMTNRWARKILETFGEHAAIAAILGEAGKEKPTGFKQPKASTVESALGGLAGYAAGGEDRAAAIRRQASTDSFDRRLWAEVDRLEREKELAKLNDELAALAKDSSDAAQRRSDELKRERDAALQAAKDAEAAAAADDEARKAREAAERARERMKDTSLGTFSGYALPQIFGNNKSNVQERQLDVQQKTLAATEESKEEIKQMRFSFEQYNLYGGYAP